MDTFFQSIIGFLAILNPFALCLYLTGIMDELSWLDFTRVFFGASLIALIVFLIFAIFGEHLLIGVLGINPASMRVFGGMVFLIVAYNYVTHGYRAAVILRGSLDELPSAIALPFMIGAGTITQAIIVGKNNHALAASGVLLITLTVSASIVLAFKLIRDHLKGQRERLFDRYVNIMARLNGLLIGAISVEMIVMGCRTLWIGQ